jgi:hypothetical protein
VHVDRDCSADTDAYRDENAYPSARHSYSDQVANEHPHARRDADADRIANTDPLTDSDRVANKHQHARRDADADPLTDSDNLTCAICLPIPIR